MKILKLKFKNLNSLRGEWCIDLTDKIYSSNGIFVITGPTGAGKTTIFDAICLALYGKTPRLENINNSQNEIMSKRTTDCYSSVEFEANGKKYIAHWHQNKARTGKLNEIKHTISESGSGDIIAEKKNGETIKKIKEITGLDFNRFKQAVMLEQGGFDNFLKANASERSQILELLTGTEIYGKISTSVYERNDYEKQKLDRIKDKRELLKPKDGFNSEEEINSELEKNNSEITKTENEFKQTKTELEQLKNIEKIKNELAQNQDEINQLNKEIEIFTSDKRKLDFGLRAGNLMPEYLRLSEKRKNIHDVQKRYENLKNSISKDSSELSKIENDILPDLEYKLKERLRGLKENENPEAVYTKAKELMKNLEEVGRKKKDLEKDNSKIKEDLTKIKLDLKIKTENYKEASENYESAMKNLYKIERLKLKKGEPCPICGSREHPFVTNYFSGNTDNDFQDLEKAKKIFDDASFSLTELQRQHDVIFERFENSQKALIENENLRIEIKSKVLEIITPLEITGKTCPEINSKLDKWLKEVKFFDSNIQTMKKNLDVLKAQIETNKNSMLNEYSNLGIFTAELENLESDFKNKLLENEFEDEEEFKKSRLDDKELEKLQRHEKELEEKSKALKAVNENITKRLNYEKTKIFTEGLKLEEIELKYKNYEQTLDNLKKLKYELEKTLEDRLKLKAELEQINQEYKIQVKICSEWEMLNNLIGQKDGGRFRVFAQKITLNVLASLANIQLERMNGRYNLIVRPDDKEGRLNLSVIDKEQANEIRPTENLSGGERFIVSLALALSLSQISGNKIKVDSLFLDEGFGSLDEEALSTALDALGEIRNEGKLIGIISHVQALKDRIATQINVIPKREGISILEGAGVFRLT